VLGRPFQLVMCLGTAVVGVLLALVIAPGGEMAAMGWILAVLGAVGVVACVLLPVPNRGGRERR
jgi:hypothetical protein